MAAATRLLCDAMFHLGDGSAAVGLATSVARRLEPELSNQGAAGLSVLGMLYLKASMAAAHIEARSQVPDLLDAAGSVAAQLGSDGNAMWTAFGPTNVQLHRVEAAVRMKNGGDAVIAAGQLTDEGVAGLPRERRANFLTETVKSDKDAERRREFGRYLAGLREARELSQSEAARRICEVSGAESVTRHEISRYERGERLPESWLAAIAQVYETPQPELERALAFARGKRAQSHQAPPSRVSPPAWDATVPAPRVTTADRRFNGLADDALALSTWLEETNVGQTTIDGLSETAHRLAEDHSRIAPRRLLADVVAAHRRTSTVLKDGRQRMAQTRDLLHIDAALLAHACILIGDLKDDLTATACARTAALCAAEAGSTPAAALSAHAKTARWRRQFTASADLARQGWECSPQTPVRVLLACQEANAAALAGDVARARRALAHAEEAATGPLAEDSGVSPWSCTRPRRALYALSVALHTSDPHDALQAAAMADRGWAEGEPWIYGTWAQVRFGAAIAHVMLGDLEQATAEMAPVMTLPPEYRLSTITNYLVAMDQTLCGPRFRGSEDAAALREQIREFNTAALPPSHPEEIA